MPSDLFGRGGHLVLLEKELGKVLGRLTTEILWSFITPNSTAKKFLVTQKKRQVANTIRLLRSYALLTSPK